MMEKRSCQEEMIASLRAWIIIRPRNISGSGVACPCRLGVADYAPSAALTVLFTINLLLTTSRWSFTSLFDNPIYKQPLIRPKEATMTKLPEAQLAGEAQAPIDDPDVPQTRKAFVPLGEFLTSLIRV